MSLFTKNVILAEHTNYRIGGPAKYFFEPRTVEELRAGIAEARSLNEKIFILGGGYNLLVSDKGFDGVVIKPIIQNLSVDEHLVVSIGAGVHIKDFLDFCIAERLSGWEWAGGLPSSVGGAVWGNAGAFGGETKDSVIDVQSLRLSDDAIVTRTNVECLFTYRSSIFKTKATNEVIVSARIQMRRGTPETLQQLIEEKKEYRKNKQPLEYPNCGSIFKNTPIEKVPAATLALFRDKIKSDPQPVLPTAVLTAAAGLKEFRIGGAMVSPKHANFIINVGDATASDVKAVMHHVYEVVKQRFGVELEQEVIFVGE